MTNLGDTPINTSDLAYDDSSQSIDVALILPAFELDPGESAIFLIDIDADDPQYPDAGTEFLAVWDMFPLGGNLSGGQADGGLSSSNPDSATLMDINGTIIDSFAYDPATDLGDNRTMERIGEGPMDHRPSVLGENGAFESLPFNDPDSGKTEVDKNGDPILLVGSPGIFLGFNEVLVGDVNCDGAINLLDVGPFIEMLGTGEFDEKADINGDGAVNLLDVTPFVELLGGG